MGGGGGTGHTYIQSCEARDDCREREGRIYMKRRGEGRGGMCG